MHLEKTIKNDEDYMRLALQQAAIAAAKGEVPVGAVAVDAEGRVLGRAYNQVEMLKDGTAHAEMIVLTQAAAAGGDWRLTEVTLFVTKEPCPMCAGAMVNCRLGRVVYGCPDPRGGAAGSALNILDYPGLLHRVQCASGVLAEESLLILQHFFQQRRRDQNQS